MADPESLAAKASPATFIGQALGELTGLERLQEGIQVKKVSGKGNFQTRFVTLSPCRHALYLTSYPISGSSKTKKRITGSFWWFFSSSSSSSSSTSARLRCLDVADLSGLQVGIVGTPRLEDARTKNRLKGLDSRVDQLAPNIVSILFHGTESLNVICQNEEDTLALANGLRQLRTAYHASKVWISNEARLLRYIWMDIDLDRNGGISSSEFKSLLLRINFSIPQPQKEYSNYLKEINQKSNEKKQKSLNYSQMMGLLQLLKNKQGKAHMSAANAIWDTLFGNKVNKVSAQVFMDKFLHASQGMTYLQISDVYSLLETLAAVERYSVGLEEPQGSHPAEEITRARFELFLFDSMNDAYDPVAQHAALPSDYGTQPISRYWINSSHNTYLTGDQLQSSSSVHAYMNALFRGCKCLELDVWDGVFSNKTHWPVIFHGHTMTSKILFRDVISAVASYMVANPETFPVVLSLENHCSLPFQQAMAKDLKTILGNALWVPPSKASSDKYVLPSPQELIGKVIIKGKRPPEDDDDDEEEETKAQGGGKAEEGKDKPPKVSPELAKLTLLHGSKYRQFEKSIKEPAAHMHSIGETKIPKILSAKKQKNPGDLWRQYNADHMTRTYPGGTRVDSSNYNPITAWAVGCQLVALNFQTPDSPLILNDGRFRERQQVGYLLKPPGVLPGREAETSSQKSSSKNEGDERFEHFTDFVAGLPPSSIAGPQIPERWHSPAQFPTNHSSSIKISVRIVAGSCLPKPDGAKSGETIDPYVSVTLHDAIPGSDGKLTYAEKSFDTKAVNNNGFCPIWNNATKEFEVMMPQVAMLQFSLKEQDVGLDDRVAEAAIPCHCLRVGYRSITLYDLNGTKAGPFAFCTLLCEIKVLDLPTDAPPS